MNKSKSFRSYLTFTNVFLVFLIVLNLLPIFAPIFVQLGWIAPAKIIYFIYSFFCHQIDWRSLHIYDFQVAWCARDSAIWGGMLITSLLLKKTGIKGLQWYQILPFMIPIALDGGIQTIASMVGLYSGPLYVSTNLMRSITGSLFGIGLAAVLMPLVSSIETQSAAKKTYQIKNITLTLPKLLALAFAIGMVIYFVFVQIWQITSTNVKPSNAFDSAVKLQSLDSLVIERRKDGLCPVTIGGKQEYSLANILATKCFFPDKTQSTPTD